jgi:hypothetical protein
MEKGRALLARLEAHATEERFIYRPPLAAG